MRTKNGSAFLEEELKFKYIIRIKLGTTVSHQEIKNKAAKWLGYDKFFSDFTHEEQELLMNKLQEILIQHGFWDVFLADIK